MASKREGSKARRTASTLIYPLVQKVGLEFRLSDANIAELERVGEIELSGELRKKIAGIGWNWSAQLRALHSPRPKQFRMRLELIEDTLEDALEALDLNRADAAIWEHHLFNWAANTKVQGAANFFENSDELMIRMQRMQEFIPRLKQALPPDGGRHRSYDDERYIIALADIFEEAGGRPVAYWSIDGICDKAFLRFMRVFYRMLPVQSKRKPKGFDGAVRQAMRSRKLARQKT